MTYKSFCVITFFSLFIFACAEDNDIIVPRNLQEYIESTTTIEFGEVIASAANASANTSLCYIFYYPEEGATDIRYYEADSLNVDENDFTNYKRKSLSIQDVFGGKLQSFSRSGADENWCLVTYVLDGKLHKSNPIRLKNATNPTGWTNEVSIEFTETLKPKFTWSDFGITDNAIYFQVISEVVESTFISGTYTYDKSFQYFNDSNVILNINVPETPNDLLEDTEYLFTMMGVSADNWVNLIIQESFIPRNLQEYLDVNSTKTIENTIAFAASNSANQSLSYIYYYPLTGASDFRYYETDDVTVDETNFSNYRRKTLSDEAVLGGKLRRYSRTDAAESWSIVTYIIDDKLYKSDPIRIKNQTKPSEWLTELQVPIDFSQSLMPKFTWTDGTYVENVQYFQVLLDGNNTFLSGTFTTEKTFQYYNALNVTSFIHTENPPTLVFSDEYNFTLMGLSNDNWVNLVIQESFLAE